MHDEPENVIVQVRDDRPGDSLPDLRWELRDAVLAGAWSVVVDVSHVQRLSSSTLAALLCVHRRCRARGGGVVIRGGSRATLEVLRRSGLHRVFDVEAAPGAGSRAYQTGAT